MENTNNQPTRFVRLYALLTLCLGSVGIYEGLNRQNTGYLIFSGALILSSLLLLALLRFALYTTVFLVIGGTIFYIYKFVTADGVFVALNNDDGLSYIIDFGFLLTLLMVVGVIIAPTIYAWTRGKYLK